MAADELTQLLVSVIQRPAEAGARRKAAEALEQRGASDEAMAVLGTLVNFTGHELGSRLPCLCKTCLASSTATVELDGALFRRTFAVHGTRVLWFWLIEELAGEQAEVKRAVAEALRGRLARKQPKRWGGDGGGGGDDDDDDGDDDDDSDDDEDEDDDDD